MRQADLDIIASDITKAIDSMGFDHDYPDFVISGEWGLTHRAAQEAVENAHVCETTGMLSAFGRYTAHSRQLVEYLKGNEQLVRDVWAMEDAIILKLTDILFRDCKCAKPGEYPK